MFRLLTKVFRTILLVYGIGVVLSVPSAGYVAFQHVGDLNFQWLKETILVFLGIFLFFTCSTPFLFIVSVLGFAWREWLWNQVFDREKLTVYTPPPSPTNMAEDKGFSLLDWLNAEDKK